MLYSPSFRNHALQPRLSRPGSTAPATWSVKVEVNTGVLDWTKQECEHANIFMYKTENYCIVFQLSHCCIVWLHYVVLLLFFDLYVLYCIMLYSYGIVVLYCMHYTVVYLNCYMYCNISIILYSYVLYVLYYMYWIVCIVLHVLYYMYSIVICIVFVH